MTYIHPEDVNINGNANNTQLQVKGVAQQTQPLQAWQDSTGSTLTRVANDGRVQVGSDAQSVGLPTPDALIEAHRHQDATNLPKTGLHSLGKIRNLLSAPVNWMIAELEFVLTGVLSSIHTALRVRNTYNRTDASPSAELRGIDVEVKSLSGQVGNLTGIKAAVYKTGGTVTDAYGVKVDDVNAGGTNNYALHTGQGIVRHGDKVELAPPASTTGTNFNSLLFANC